MTEKKISLEKQFYLPEVGQTTVYLADKESKTNGSCPLQETETVPTVKGNSLCPCCGYLTIPNGGNALAYICPVCFWEIDFFIQSDNEPSDQNHGLTLVQARKNYKQYGAVLPRLVRYVRAALPEEKVIPEKE